MSSRKVFKTLVVAISGVTCSGKTTIAQALQKKYPFAKIIRQDDFFYPPDYEKLPRSLGGLNHANWESMNSLNMVSMLKTVQETLNEMNEKRGGLLFIEGFLVLNHLPLAELCDLKYFLTLPKDICLGRRKTRTDYDPPDPAGYFELCVWPMYELNFKDLQSAPYARDVKYLDGTLPVETNLETIIADIEKSLHDSRYS